MRSPQALLALLNFWKSAHPAGTVEHETATDVEVSGSTGVDLSVSRSDGSTGPASVDFATADGSALAGADYTAKTGTLVWSDGDTASKTIGIALSGSAFTGNSRDFTVVLSHAQYATLGSVAVATVTLAPEDDPGAGGAGGTISSGGSTGTGAATASSGGVSGMGGTTFASGATDGGATETGGASGTTDTSGDAGSPNSAGGGAGDARGGSSNGATSSGGASPNGAPVAHRASRRRTPVRAVATAARGAPRRTRRATRVAAVASAGKATRRSVTPACSSGSGCSSSLVAGAPSGAIDGCAKRPIPPLPDGSKPHWLTNAGNVTWRVACMANQDDSRRAARHRRNLG